LLKLIIGNRAYSSWSMRGWLACKQSGEDFEELVVPMFDREWEQRREGDEFAPSLGKVPILWDGEIVVWDSMAIIEFLADRVGPALYWPEDEAARAVARSMAAEMHSGFSNLRRDLPMNVRRTYSPSSSANRSKRRSTASSSCGRRRGRGSAAPEIICSATGAPRT
jgi:glutathione S-transferase